MEAVEHERQILGLESGTVIANGQDTVAERHLDDSPAAAVLGGVVEQVGDGAGDPVTLAVDQRGVDRRGQLQPGEPAPRAIDRRGHDLIDPDLGGIAAELGPPGQFHHVAHQRRQLVQFLDHIVAQRIAVLGREPFLVVGAIDHIELWNPTTYMEKVNAAEEIFKQGSD